MSLPTLREWLLSLTSMWHLSCFQLFTCNLTFQILFFFIQIYRQMDSSYLQFYLQKVSFVLLLNPTALSSQRWFELNSKTHSSVLRLCALKIGCNPGLHHSNAQIHRGKKEGRMTRLSHMPAREEEWGYRWNFPSLISLWRHVQWQTLAAAARQSGVSDGGARWYSRSSSK